MAKSKKEPNVVSRIQSLIDDIQRQCNDEVGALERAKQSELDKALFTFGEIRRIYRIAKDSEQIRFHSSDQQSAYWLFDEITKAAKTKI